MVLTEIIERSFEALDSSLATVQGWLDKIGPTIPIPSWMGGGDAAKEAAKPAESVKDVWKKTVDDIKAIVEGGQREIDAIWGRGKAPAEQIGKASEATVTLKQRFDEVLDSVKGAAGGDRRTDAKDRDAEGSARRHSRRRRERRDGAGPRIDAGQRRGDRSHPPFRGL